MTTPHSRDLHAGAQNPARSGFFMTVSMSSSLGLAFLIVSAIDRPWFLHNSRQGPTERTRKPNSSFKAWFKYHPLALTRRFFFPIMNPKTPHELTNSSYFVFTPSNRSTRPHTAWPLSVRMSCSVYNPEASRGQMLHRINLSISPAGQVACI